MKTQHSLSQLFTPHAIAIIGASAKEGKVGHTLVENICGFGYQGKVFFVNQNKEEIRGQHVFASITDIEQSVDLAIIAIPGAFVYEVIAAAADKCSTFVVISAGFGETGIEGHNREMQLHALAQKKNLTILGPNCLGFLTPRWGLNASFAPGLPAVGDTAFVSQSGALAVALIDRARSLGIGFSYVVSIGNKMQVTEVELLRYFAHDDATKTIVFYLESIVGGREFLHAIQEARAQGKRVIILKSGKTEDAQKAIALHTGSLTSGDIVTEAVFYKMGIMRAQTIADIFTLVTLAHSVPTQKKASLRVAVVTNAGGPGVITTDAIAGALHLERAQLSQTHIQQLVAQLPAAASVHNPIDLLGDALADRYRAALEICQQDDDVDVVFILLTPQKQTPAEEIAHFLVEQQKHTTKILMASFIGGDSVAKAQQILRDGNVVHVETPTDAIDALDTLMDSDCRVPAELPPLKQVKKRVRTVAQMLKKIHTDGMRGLYFEEVHLIAQAYDIPISPSWDLTNGFGGETAVTYPCVAKIDDPHILHKSDRGGVILPIKSTAALQKSVEKLQRSFPEKTARVIVQPLVHIQIELIVGMKRDPIFGPIIVVGMGGIYTEIFHKTEVFVSPCTAEEIKSRLDSGALTFLFNGARGQKQYRLDEVVAVVLALQAIADEHTIVQAIDINPLLIYNDDTRARAVDMKIIF